MAVKTNSNYIEAYEQIADLAYRLSQYKEGLDACNQLLRINNKKPDYYALRAKFYKALKKDEKAYTDYKKAIALNTQDAGIYFETAQMEKNRKNDSGFLKYISKAITINPEYIEALYERGIYYYQHNDTVKANTDLSKVYEKNKEKYGESLPTLLGEIAFYKKKYKKALTFYNDIINTYHSKDAVIWTHKALCQKELKLLNDAVKTLNKAAAYNRTNPEILIERALINDQLGKAQLAKSDFTKAINLDKKNPLPYYRRGLYYMNKEKFDAAITDFTLAIKYNKKPDPDYFFYRGSCYYAIHQKDKACEDLSKATEMGHQKAKKIKFEICY